MDKHEWPHRDGEWNLEVRRTAKGVFGTATVEDLEEEVLRLAGFKEVLEQITLALGCLPTQFPDVYDHVLQRVRDLVLQAERNAKSITLLLDEENAAHGLKVRSQSAKAVHLAARLDALLCPDHRDKAPSGSCLLCELESAQRVAGGLSGFVVWHRHDGQTVKLVAVTEAEESIPGAKLYVCYEPDPEGRPS